MARGKDFAHGRFRIIVKRAAVGLHRWAYGYTVALDGRVVQCCYIYTGRGAMARAEQAAVEWCKSRLARKYLGQKLKGGTS